jgi:hypothetical protein
MLGPAGAGLPMLMVWLLYSQQPGRRFFVLPHGDLSTLMAGGEMVSQGSLEPLFQVRILARQPSSYLRTHVTRACRARA